MATVHAACAEIIVVLARVPHSAYHQGKKCKRKIDFVFKRCDMSIFDQFNQNKVFFDDQLIYQLVITLR